MSVLPLLLAAAVYGVNVSGAGPVAARFTRAPDPLPLRWVSAPAARRADPWLGEDKARHLFMSFALTTFSFAGARAGGLDARRAMSVAGGIALAAGIGKEIHDERSGRLFSVRDLVFDLLGIGLGLTLASTTR